MKNIFINIKVIYLKIKWTCETYILAHQLGIQKEYIKMLNKKVSRNWNIDIFYNDFTKDSLCYSTWIQTFIVGMNVKQHKKANGYIGHKIYYKNYE